MESIGTAQDMFCPYARDSCKTSKCMKWVAEDFGKEYTPCGEISDDLNEAINNVFKCQRQRGCKSCYECDLRDDCETCIIAENYELLCADGAIRGDFSCDPPYCKDCVYAYGHCGA